VAQPVCLSLLAVSSRLLPVADHSLAIRQRPTLGRRGAISGGALAVRGRAHRDLHATVVGRGAGESRQRTVTQGDGLITLGRRRIASVGNGVTTGGRADTTHQGATSLPRGALAKLTRELMHSGVSTLDQATVAGQLIHIGRRLVAVRGGLVAVRRALIAVGPCLIGVRECLIAFAEHLIVGEHCRESRLALMPYVKNPKR
jgi:hypothetical protein